MTKKVVSLSRHRKVRERADKRARGDANAIKFGRTKAEREREAIEEARAARAHDAHKLGRPKQDDGAEE